MSPPTFSTVKVQVVTDTCSPLRAELTVGGFRYQRALQLTPACPGDENLLTPCSTGVSVEECIAACPHLTTWKNPPTRGPIGTAPMHVFDVFFPDDGTNAGPAMLTVHLKLSTFDGEIVWDGEMGEELAPLEDHRAGYFHHGTVEFRLNDAVLRALGQNCREDPE